MRSKRIPRIITVFILFMLVALTSFIGFTANFVSAETGNPLDLAGTNLNGAVLLTDTTRHIPVRSYITKLDKGYDVSTGTESYALVKDGVGAPYVNFFVDTLGEGGSVYKGASQYHGYNAYGFVAGEGEDIYRHDEEKDEDILIGKQSVAIKLNYNFDSTENLQGIDGKTWDICNDTWKASVNGIGSVGVVGRGAVIVQKFVPSVEQSYPNVKDDWIRLNEYSGLETDGLHTVNFFDEFAPSFDKNVTVYSPSGKDLQKGVFVKITVAYELVHTDINIWYGIEIRNKTYKNIVEETVFYLCNTSAEVVFNNLYCGDGTTGEDADKPENGENTVEKHGGVISNNQGAIEGFRADINGWNYDVTYRMNNSSNTFTCDDGQVFVEPGRYDFTIKSKLGIVRHKTVYIHEKSQDENIKVYFGDGLISQDSKRVFDPSETYPVYVKGSVTLQTPNENASFVKHAPLVGKVYLIEGDWNNIDSDDGGTVKTVVAEKSASNHRWSFSDLPAGKYEAVFYNNEEYFNGTATGDTYKFVWRFSVVDEGYSPIVNETLLYQQVGVGDYASLNYIALIPSSGGAGNVCVVFENEESAYYFECKYLASTVKINGNQFIFDDKAYNSESEMLLDLHTKARSLVRKHYFDATDDSTYVTVSSDNIKPVLGDNPSEKDKEQYQELLAEYVSILSQKFDRDIFVFADEDGRENLAIGEPFLNDRLFAYINKDGKIERKTNPLYFIQVADFESSSVILHLEGTDISFSIPYGVGIQEYLVNKCAPSGRYRIVESNAYGTTEYSANYIRPGDMVSSLTIERLYYNNYVEQTLSKANDGLRLRANWFKISDISNDLDPYGIIKIKLPNNETLLYQIDEYETIPEFNEVGNYEIKLVDRLGNYEIFYIDIFTSEKVYTVTLMDGENIIKSEVAYGGKRIVLDPLSSQNSKYVFYGWQDEEGNIYQDFYSFNKPRDIVLKAVWHYTSVDVSIYDGNKVNELTSTVGATLQLPELKKDGYELYGFRYILNDGKYKFYRGQINDVLNVESMRLDAVWKKAEVGSLNITAGVGDNVIITLIDGIVKDTISFTKGEKVQLPKIENQNGLIFSGWVYEYRLKGIVFGDYLTYEEVDSVGLLNRNSIKLTAVYVTDAQQKTDDIDTSVVGAGSISDNSTPTPGMHINSQTAKSCTIILAILLCCIALVIAFTYRKRILVFVQKQITALKLRTQQEMSAAKESSVAQKPVTANYNSVTSKQSLTQRVRAWIGLSTATINRSNIYKKVFFPILIIALTFVLLFYTQYEFIYNATNTFTAVAETYSEQTADVEEDNKEYGRITDAKNIVRNSDSYEDKDIEFLYSNVLIDLLSFGYEDVFTAYAIAGDKRVEGLGYTSYVDAYGDEENYIFGAGFVSLAGENCLTSDDVQNEVKVYVADEEADNYEYTEFKLTTNQSWGPVHYVAYDKYVQYSVANYIIQPIIANDTGEYNEALGDVYSYDLGDYCHYVNYDTTFDFDAYGINANMDYDQVLQVYKETIEEQIRSSVSIEVKQADFISVQALNDYIAHDQDERFLGVEAEALMYYEANITDNQYYIVYENGEVGVLELPPDPEKKASIWERIWMGLASAAGAVIGVIACAIPGVGPVLGGAMISASLDLFTQVTIGGTSPSNIDWVSVGISAVTGALTGGIGAGANALVGSTVKTVGKFFLKLGVEVAAGLFSGAVSYVAGTVLRGGELNFTECLKSMAIGAATGAIIFAGGQALSAIAHKVNINGIGNQLKSALKTTGIILGGSLAGMTSYVLACAISGQEITAEGILLATAMGAATTTLMVVGGKIVKTIKTAQVRRQERAIRRQEKTQGDIIKRLQEGSKKINKEYAGQRKKFDPNSIQAKKYPNGVEFDENGFARFEEYSVKSVKFEFPSEEGLINNRCLNGNYYHDEKLANAFIGYDSTPEGYVWHHVEDMQTMLLVPQDVHSSMMGGCSHTGGACYIKKYIAEEMKK